MEVHVALGAEVLFHIGPIPVTNAMLCMFLVMIAMIIVGQIIARRATLIPGRVQGLLEMGIEFLLGLVEGTAGKRNGRRVFPLIAALFMFILFANWTELLPGIGTIGYWHHEAGHAKELVPFFRPPTSDLNMTLAMAFITFFTVQIIGVRAHGVFGRIKHMADPWWIFPLEVIQELARIISLSFRLFGNIFAGDVLLGVMYSIGASLKIAVIPILFPIVFLGLELLFTTIQALVFALLTLIYIVLALGEHPEEEHLGHGETESQAPQPAAAGIGD